MIAFMAMGIAGFIVQLIFIPFNNIIAGYLSNNSSKHKVTVFRKAKRVKPKRRKRLKWLSSCS